MAIRFDCPHCKANYEVADDLGGKMIMCRVCQKRGAVRSLAAASAAPAAAAGSVAAGASSVSRRKFFVIGAGVLASLGAVGTGALLARRPWRHWGEEEPENQPGGPWRGRGGPPRDGKDRPPRDGKDQGKTSV